MQLMRETQKHLQAAERKLWKKFQAICHHDPEDETIEQQPTCDCSKPIVSVNGQDVDRSFTEEAASASRARRPAA
jgi:hypothetical protein